MKLLSIGNSFSVDAQAYLHQVAKAEGETLECHNLFIGGCSLERHVSCANGKIRVLAPHKSMRCSWQ